MHQITWTCNHCGAEIKDNEGSLRVDNRQASDRATAVSTWEETHEDPETGSINMTAARVLDTMPARISWDVTHYSCDGDGVYEIDVARLRGPWDLLSTTAHLLEKTWLQHTNWDTLLWDKISHK